MWNQWSQYGVTQPPLPMAAAPPPPPSEPVQAAPPPQPAAQQPVMIGPVAPPTAVVAAATTPVPTAGPANATTTNPYSQYTAAQYAALTPEQQYSLQQHWQQWQKYQEEYAKWHAQYGEQYKREMEAVGKTPGSTYPAAAYSAPVAIGDAKASGKITGQPQLYSQPPPQVGPTNQFPTMTPAPTVAPQQPPPPPPPQQQPPQQPHQYQQQPPPQWQSNQSFYNQPPPNFNPSAAPPNNFQNFNNSNTNAPNSWSTGPPPHGGQMTQQQPPPFDSQRGNEKGQAGNTNFNVGNNTGQPPHGNWNNGGPNNRGGFGSNNNNRGRAPNNDNNQFGRRSGPSNMPPNQDFNRGGPNDGPNSMGNQESNNWQQRGPNNRGNNGPNNWSQGPNMQDNRGPNDWQGDSNLPDKKGPIGLDDAENDDENIVSQKDSFNRDNNMGSKDRQGGPINRGDNRYDDWNNSPRNRDGNNWNDGPNNRGRNDGGNSRDISGRNRGSFNSRDGDDGQGNSGRNSRGSNDRSRNSLNNRDDDNRDGNSRYGAWNDGPNNRFNNRPSDWNENRGNNNRSWGDNNRGPNNWSDGPNAQGNNNWNAIIGGGNNRGNFGPGRNQQNAGPSGNAGPGGRSNAPDIDEEMFDRQFKQWEEQFEDWKRANANHPDREMYDRYEQEFEKQRKRIVERREQMRRRKMERMGLDPNQQLLQPPNPPTVGSDMGCSNSSRDSSRNRGDISEGRGNPLKAEEAAIDVTEADSALDDGTHDDNKTAMPFNTLQRSLNSNTQKSTPLGKRKSRFDNAPPSKIMPKTSNTGVAEIINLDDDEDEVAEDCDDRNLENEEASKDHMTEIFKKSDGIPGLDLVEGDTPGDTKVGAVNESTPKIVKQPTQTKKIPSLFEIKINKLELKGNEDRKNEPVVAPVADISKTLNDPEFMKQISEAVAKAQGKDDRQIQQQPEELHPPNQPNEESLVDNDNSNDVMSLKSGVGNEIETEHNNTEGPSGNFGPNGPDNWGPNNVPNNWGPNSGGPNNWGPTKWGNNGGPNNWGPNNCGPNNWNNSGGPNNNNWGANSRGPNNNGPFGPNNRGGNNWNPNNGGGPNNWGPNNGGGGPNNNNWAPNNNRGPNNGPWGGNGGPWGPNSNCGPNFGNNGGGGGFNNWGPNGPNNNFGPNFRGNNNRNFGPNGPNGSNFGPNGPNGPNSPNFGGNGPHIRNFGNNAPGRNFDSQNQPEMDKSQDCDQQTRNVNNPFRRNEGGAGGLGNQRSLEDNSNATRSPWAKGPGDNLEYGDYYRPVQVIDYANNANIAPKVIDYGHKPVSEDFKPVKVINYDHVTKVGKRANLTQLERQRRGQKRRNRRKQQREELFNQSSLANATINQQDVAVTATGDNEEQLEDISDTDDLPDDVDARAESPAPPPPPLFSSGSGGGNFIEAETAPSSIFPSTAGANDNIAKVEIHHVQTSIPTVENNNTISIEEILMQPGRETRPKKICIILRGPPGSGKSHVAKLIKEREKEMSGNNPRVLSIDDYFLIENDYDEKCPKTGKKLPKKEILYEYDKAMEDTYMQYLIKSFKKTIADNFYDFIVIDCNNNSLRTLNEFYCHSKDSGYVPYIVDLFCDLETCMNQNVHDRTESDIKLIIETWKPTPFHYIKLDVSSLLQNIVEMEDADDMAVDENTVSEIADAQSQADENDKENAADDNTNSNDNDEAIGADEDDEAEEDSNDSNETQFGGGFLKSKWETDTTTQNLARLDGTSKLNSKRKQTMEEYLQMDDWQPAPSIAKGKKRVRWADIEEKREQEKMRAVGFVVGQTDWKRMMDPNAARRALNKTKYIERVNKNRR